MRPDLGNCCLMDSSLGCPPGLLSSWDHRCLVHNKQMWLYLVGSKHSQSCLSADKSSVAFESVDSPVSNVITNGITSPSLKFFFFYLQNGEY